MCQWIEKEPNQGSRRHDNRLLQFFVSPEDGDRGQCHECCWNIDDAALGDIERVRSLLEELESREAVARLLDRAREAEAMRIFIGSENRLFALSGSSVIASPYRDREGRVVGVVGVIGPTRLNYARVVPMVDFTAQSLGKLIG